MNKNNIAGLYVDFPRKPHITSSMDDDGTSEMRDELRRLTAEDTKKE